MWKITESKSGLEEADVLIWKVDLEARSLQLSAKAFSLVCGELMKYGIADLHVVSADQRGRLAMSVKRLDQSRNRVRESRRPESATPNTSCAHKDTGDITFWALSFNGPHLYYLLDLGCRASQNEKRFYSF
ncbi:unnamed protein product [Arabidopsis lyrata]|nr:unnamed protein product [Arabidopsis lyrata]